jgi:hypothetical protein
MRHHDGFDVTPLAEPAAQTADDAREEGLRQLREVVRIRAGVDQPEPTVDPLEMEAVPVALELDRERREAVQFRDIVGHPPGGAPELADDPGGSRTADAEESVLEEEGHAGRCVEHVGNLVIYIRMKGIVPPTSEPAFRPEVKK